MSTIHMLKITRIKGAVCIGISDLTKAFDPCAVGLWLKTVKDAYRVVGFTMKFDDQTLAFIEDNGESTEAALASLSAPGRLLMDVVCNACTMPTHGDFDENLKLIALTFVQARDIKENQGALKVVYTVRKPNPNALTRVMTLRSDMHGTFGSHAGSLVSSALVTALSRELKSNVHLLNPPAAQGEKINASGPAVRFTNYLDGLAYRLFVDYVLNLTAVEIKSQLNCIKAISDHYHSIALPVFHDPLIIG